MATKAKVRKYSIDYLKYGFIAAPHDEGLALCLLCTPMKDNIFGSEAFILLTKMEMHYRRKEFQNFLQNLALIGLGAHDGLHQKSTLAFIRHCSQVGGGGNDKLAIDKGGNLPEKVENHCTRPMLLVLTVRTCIAFYPFSLPVF